MVKDTVFNNFENCLFSYRSHNLTSIRNLLHRCFTILKHSVLLESIVFFLRMFYELVTLLYVYCLLVKLVILFINLTLYYKLSFF